MYYAIFPKYDATIYEKHNDRNTGIDEIIELVKIAPNTADPEGGYWEDTYNSRILMKFDIDALNTLLNAGTVSKSSTYYLVLHATEASDLPVDYTIEAYPISASWENGNGSYYDYPELTRGVSWIYRDGSFNQTGKKWVTGSLATQVTASYKTTAGGGTWYTGSGYVATQSYDYTDPDIRMDVTDIVHKWLSSSIENNGFILKRSTTDEFNESHMGSIKYFSKDTHTIFSPKLEAVWDDSVLTGTGSFNEVDSTKEVTIHIKNIRPEYKEGERIKFRLQARERFPTKTYSTSSQYLTAKRLPTSSYYSVKDSVTELDIIPFDDNTTRLSVDTTGNYFTLDTTAFMPERYYRILFKVVQEGGDIKKIIDNKYYFKVVR